MDHWKFCWPWTWIFVFWCDSHSILQAWELFQGGELVSLLDPLLNVDYDTEEACRFLKVGLLCTQEMLKLRPNMSTVVKMLTGEMEVDDEMIMHPGFCTNYTDMKVTAPTENADLKNTSHSVSPPPHASSSCLTNTTYPSLTFTAISDRSSWGDYLEKVFGAWCKILFNLCYCSFVIFLFINLHCVYTLWKVRLWILSRK